MEKRARTPPGHPGRVSVLICQTGCEYESRSMKRFESRAHPAGSEAEAPAGLRETRCWTQRERPPRAPGRTAPPAARSAHRPRPISPTGEAEQGPRRGTTPAHSGCDCAVRSDLPAAPYLARPGEGAHGRCGGRRRRTPGGGLSGAPAGKPRVQGAAGGLKEERGARPGRLRTPASARAWRGPRRRCPPGALAAGACGCLAPRIAFL